MAVFLSFAYIGLHDSVFSFCLKRPGSRCGDDLVAVTLKEQTNSGSVGDILHIVNVAGLHSSLKDLANVAPRNSGFKG
jgi:hypothetical protein